MKCPKCNYVSHDYLDTCRKCSMNLSVFKQQIGLFVLQPGMINLSAVLGNRSGSESFDNTEARVGVDDFDISLDDYSDRPVMRRAPGTFIRPDMQQEGGNLQHLTLQLDASAMSTELPRSIIQPPAQSPGVPGSQAPPPLPPANRPEEPTDSSQGHLTLDLGASGNLTNLVSGLFPQPPQSGRPSPAQLAGTERVRRPDAESTEEAPPLPPPGPSGGPRASGLPSQSVTRETERRTERLNPLRDATTDEIGGALVQDVVIVQEESRQPLAGGQVTEPGGGPLPTLQLAIGDSFDDSPSIMEPVERNGRLLRSEPSTDRLTRGEGASAVTEDAFDIADRLRNVSSPIPSPAEMLPSGMMPQAGVEATRSRQTAGDTLDALTSNDFGGDSRAFNAQRSTMNTNDEPGLLEDENPFQFDLEEMDFDSKNVKRSQEPQHESMPGRLTLELDAGAMSIELSSASMDDPAAPNMSATERRTIELRLDEAMTGLPLANTAFNSLADTAELDETPLGAQPRPGTPDRNANAPTAPGQLGPEVTGEFLLDLDDLGDDPRPSRS